MRKLILVLGFALTAFIGMSLTSCGDESTEAKDKTEKTEAAVYQCPMKCEGEKTYDKAGNCPKCGMEIKQISGENHNGHNH